MSENKFTPGPWVCRHSNGTFLPRIYDSKGGLIAIFKSLKNATDLEVFAAAPELLEACEEFVRKVECGAARSTQSYEQMKKAIAKAKGEL